MYKMCSGVVATLALAVAVPTVAHAEPVPDGCVRLDGSTGLKSGHYTLGELNVDVTVDNNPVTGQSFSYVADRPVMSVKVKGATDALIFTTQTTDLHAPANASGKWADVSHADFCGVGLTGSDPTGGGTDTGSGTPTGGSGTGSGTGDGTGTGSAADTSGQGTPAGTPATGGSSGDAAAVAAVGTASRAPVRCLSTRLLTLRVAKAHGLIVRKARVSVTVGGRRLAASRIKVVRKGSRIVARINLAGQSPKPVKVRFRATYRTAQGKSVVRVYTRNFRLCVPRVR